MTEHRHPREIAAEIREQSEPPNLADALVWGSYRSLRIFLRSIEWIDMPREKLQRYTIEHDGTADGIFAAIRLAMSGQVIPVPQKGLDGWLDA